MQSQRRNFSSLLGQTPVQGKGGRSPQLPRHLNGIERLAEAIHTDTREFRRQLRTCRRRPEASPVHDLRIASRRLMAWCDLLVWLGVESSVSEVRQELKRLFRALARLRDTQVQLELLRGAPASLEAPGRRCRRWLRGEERRESKRVRRRCRETRPRWLAAELLGGLKSVAVIHRFRENPQLMEEHLNRWLQGLGKRVTQSCSRVNAVDPSTLHRLRITLKPLRYASESLTPIGGVQKQFPLGRLRQMQSALGSIQDAEVFLNWLQEAKADHPRRARELQNLERWVDRSRDSRIRSVFRDPSLKAILEAGKRVGR